MTWHTHTQAGAASLLFHDFVGCVGDVVYDGQLIDFSKAHIEQVIAKINNAVFPLHSIDMSSPLM